MDLCKQTRKQLLDECQEMLEYALSKGLSVPEKVLERIGSACQTEGEGTDAMATQGKLTLPQLGSAHQQLSKLILPATPGALSYLSEHRCKNAKNWWRRLGPIPLIRYLIVAALVSLVLMLGLAAIEGIDGHLEWANGGGLFVLGDELFLLAAAGLGASFAALFKASQYITNRTFDPQFINTYWLRFVLGLIAGMVLAMLIAPSESAAGPASGVQTESMSANISYFTKPLLAMLGGFSASGVYRILSRLVQAFETLVAGKATVGEELLTQRRLLDAEQTQARATLAARLANLRSQSAEGTLSDGIDQIISELTGEDADTSS